MKQKAFCCDLYKVNSIVYGTKAFLLQFVHTYKENSCVYIYPQFTNSEEHSKIILLSSKFDFIFSVLIYFYLQISFQLTSWLSPKLVVLQALLQYLNNRDNTDSYCSVQTSYQHFFISNFKISYLHFSIFYLFYFYLFVDTVRS